MEPTPSAEARRDAGAASAALSAPEMENPPAAGPAPREAGA